MRRLSSALHLQAYSLDDLAPDRTPPPTSSLDTDDAGAASYDPYEVALPEDELLDYERQLALRTANYGVRSVPASAQHTTDHHKPRATSSSLVPPVVRTIEEASTMKPTDTTANAIPPNNELASNKPAATSSTPPSDIPDTHVHASQQQGDYWKRAGYGTPSDLDQLQATLDTLQRDIYQRTGGTEFNINSPAQVSLALFGEKGQSTNKDVLDAMAGGGNQLARSILEYRTVRQQLQKRGRKVEHQAKGTAVQSVSTVKRHDRVQAADPLMLVDASAYIFRAYYSMPPIHRSDGTPTGAVLGFCNMLNRLVLNRMLEGDRPRLVLVFDHKGQSFRKELYNDYKGNRPAAPMDLIPQFNLIREAAIAYGIDQLEAPSYEADDVIATLATMAKAEGVDTNILSSDKDLMQLISGREDSPCVHMIDPMTMSRVTYDEVLEKWNVPPELLGDVLALAGDAADNVPGVPGIGPKIAANLVQEFGSLDNLLENVDQVKQKGRRQKLQDNLAQAKLSRKLVDLVTEVPFDTMTFPDGITQVSRLRMEAMDSDRLLTFYDQMGFKDLKRRFESRLTGSKIKRKKSTYPRKAKVEVPKPEEFADVPF